MKLPIYLGLVHSGEAQLARALLLLHERHAQDVVHGETVFEAVSTTRVLTDVATNSADGLARRIRRIKVAIGCNALRYPGIDDSWLHNYPLVRNIYSEDRVHTCN